VATHVVVGRTRDGSRAEIERLVREGGSVEKCVPGWACAGDTALFYLLSPDGSFVAIGTLATSAERRPDVERRFFAEITDVRLLPQPVRRLEVAAHVPGWGWPRQPHRTTTVPAEHEDELLGFLT
jgi:hypothetical protein